MSLSNFSEELLIADTGPLLALARVDVLPLLPKMFGRVILPQSVANECFLKAALLIDEKRGRQFAQAQTIKTIGAAGVLLLAKEKGLLKEIKPILNELRNSGYYLSQSLIQLVLELAGE